METPAGRKSAGAAGAPPVPKARVRIHVENNAETEALRFTPAHLERILAAHPGLGERLAVTINDDPGRTDGQSDAEILFAVRKPKSLADARAEWVQSTSAGVEALLPLMP